MFAKIRRCLGWLTHCYKGLIRTYHHQLLPVFDIILDADDVVIDVGAHVGQFSKIFSKRVSKGLVLAVEPASYPASILRIVKFMHRLRTLKIIKLGISVQPGEAILQTPLKKAGLLDLVYLI